MIDDLLDTEGREPGCDDDAEDDGPEALVPLGYVLEHIRLQRRVEELERNAELVALINAAIDDRMRAALDEVLNGVRADLGEQRDAWLLLARGVAAKLPQQRRAA